MSHRYETERGAIARKARLDDSKTAVNKTQVTLLYLNIWVMVGEHARGGTRSTKRRRGTGGAWAFLILLMPLAAGCGCSSGPDTIGEQEVRRPQPAPVQVARRTARVNAFGRPIYEPVGPLPLAAAQSIEDTVGRSQEEIEDFFGPPTAAVRDGNIRVLRYRGAHCSIAFFLYQDTEGRRVVTFANHEWNGPTAANVRSCLHSFGRSQPAQRGAGWRAQPREAAVREAALQSSNGLAFRTPDRIEDRGKWIKGRWTHVSEMYMERNTRIDSVA